MHLPRTVALVAAVLVGGCRGLPAPWEPAGPGDLARPATPYWEQDDAYLQARGVAEVGAPSLVPELDAVAALASATTPELGLSALLVPVARAAPAARLRPGDLLALEVFGRPELSGERRIGPDGSIPVSLLGPLAVAGTTEVEASLAAARHVARLARKPQVQVRLLQPAPTSVRVVGRVTDPGVHPLPFERTLDCLDLIARCGGLFADADVDRLTLLRSGEDGRLRGYHFSYQELLAARPAGLSAPVLPDDVLVVPRLPEVYVFGRVQRPGAFPLRPGATVASLLLESGGLGPEASSRDLQLLRGASVTEASPTRALTAGDVVFVPERRRVYLVGEGVATSGPIDLPGSGLTVVQALAAAGWLAKHADIDRVEVLRYRGGESSRFPVPLRRILSGELRASDYPLEPGDVVHVPETVW